MYKVDIISGKNDKLMSFCFVLKHNKIFKTYELLKYNIKNDLLVE